MNVPDGLYLMYVQDNVIYPVAQSKEEWTTLQLIGNAVGGNPIQVIKDKPIGPAMNLGNYKEKDNND